VKYCWPSSSWCSKGR